MPVVLEVFLDWRGFVWIWLAMVMFGVSVQMILVIEACCSFEQKAHHDLSHIYMAIVAP